MNDGPLPNDASSTPCRCQTRLARPLIAGSRFSLEDPTLAARNVEHDQVPCFENIRVPSSKTITFFTL
jgi:hypothetical protein